MPHKYLQMFRYAITILLCSLSAISALAQTATGWYKYPVFTENIDNLIETPDKVYYRSGNSLFSYSESDNESFVYTTDNYLSDVNVKEIYYNPEKKYLLVAFDNSNIDLVYDNGKSVNLPDIKNANVYAGTGINGVSFNGDKIYVATDFGFVVFDEKRAEVKASAIFNEPVSCAIEVDGNVVIHHDGAFKKASLNDHYTRKEAYTTLFADKSQTKEIFSFGKSSLCLRNSYNAIHSFDINDPSANLTYYSTNCSLPLRLTGNGSIYTSDNDNNLIVINQEGVVEKTTLPEELKNKIVSFSTTPDKLWAATSDGIAKFSADGTQLSGSILPADCISVDVVNLMVWSPDHERLYISRAINSVSRPGSASGDTQYQTTSVIENKSAKDVSAKECTLVNYSNGRYYQEKYGNKRLYGGAYWICENPFDKDMYFINSDWNSVLAIENNKMVTSFTTANSQYNSLGNRAKGVFLDPENNLWMAMHTSKDTDYYFQVLPAEFLKPDKVTEVKKADWKPSGAKSNFGNHDFSAVFCKKSNMVYFYHCGWKRGIFAYDTKGTYADPSDDEGRNWGVPLTDQDGKSFDFIRTLTMAEDKDGQIWIGTSSGVCVITDPKTGLRDDFRVRRPKVPRNDGTNFADYLLESDAVLWISVDPANNKWMATQKSGLYLVNPDGTQILAHYDSNNSPLPTNTIYCVEQDPFSNTVYVGTDAGFYRFNCSTTPPAEDYSEIYAYPNPVRPEYNGPITISGLTEGSLVKIMDSAGSLVAQTTANGGMALWDGCNLQGRRVRSGVYYVFASSGPDAEKTSGAVTKIIVIN